MGIYDDPLFFITTIFWSQFFYKFYFIKAIFKKTFTSTEFNKKGKLNLKSLFTGVIFLTVSILINHFVRPFIVADKKRIFNNTDDYKNMVEQYVRIQQAKFENDPWVYAICKTNTDLECERDVVKFLGRYTVNARNINEINNQCSSTQ